MSNGRRVAAVALMRVQQDGAYSNIVLNDAIKSAGLDKGEAAFASALFYGSLERKITLDYYIDKLSSQPIRKISPLTLQVLRISLYQILFMDKIPDSAVVNEAVKIIKKSKENRSAGYVNAVLRNALRELPSLPIDDSAKSLSIIYSCGLSLIEKLIEHYGVDATKKILSASIKKTSIYIRVNKLRTNTDELLNLLSEMGISCQKASVENALCISDTGSIDSNNLYLRGYFHVQDISSQICANLLKTEKGQQVLDICSAPGGKAFTICENMNNIGTVVACDLYEHRVKLIEDGAKRLGLTAIKPLVFDAAVYCDEWAEKFDRVLCDVPCSGSGIIGRKPDIKYKDYSQNGELNDLQYNILTNGFKYLKPGGKMVYSTCSILCDENEDIIGRFKADFPTANITYSHTFLPHIDGTDGFFITVIEK